MRLKERKEAKRAFIVHLEIRVKRGEERRKEGFGEEGCTCEKQGRKRSLRTPS
jgi:hypothetical protein